jgi:hypothetical protein
MGRMEARFSTSEVPTDTVRLIRVDTQEMLLQSPNLWELRVGRTSEYI